MCWGRGVGGGGTVHPIKRFLVPTHAESLPLKILIVALGRTVVEPLQRHAVVDLHWAARNDVTVLDDGSMQLAEVAVLGLCQQWAWGKKTRTDGTRVVGLERF